MSAKKGMNMLGMALVGAMAIAGAGSYGWWWYQSSYVPAMQATAHVLEVLPFPDSARFRNVRVSRHGSVCGLVLAKDWRGDYGSYGHFYYDPVSLLTYVDEFPPGDFSAREMCTGAV